MKRITFIWADDMNEAETQEFQKRIDRAMDNPDVPIVTNFSVQYTQMDIPEAGDPQDVSHQCCGGAAHTKNTKRIVTIVAPNTKVEYLPALQKQIEEAIAGPKHYFVTNQALEIYAFDAPVSVEKKG